MFCGCNGLSARGWNGLLFMAGNGRKFRIDTCFRDGLSVCKQGSVKIGPPGHLVFVFISTYIVLVHAQGSIGRIIHPTYTSHVPYSEYFDNYGGLHQKSWECQDSSDNALHTKLGPPSESRVRAGPRTIDADLRTPSRFICTTGRLGPIRSIWGPGSFETPATSKDWS